MSPSPLSLVSRFFVPMPRLTEKLLQQFTHVDHTNQVAIVALIGGEIVGLANYDRVDEQQAESPSTSPTPIRAGGWGRSCWSTSRLPRASGASTGSSQTSFRRTGRWSPCSARPAMA